MATIKKHKKYRTKSSTTNMNKKEHSTVNATAW